MIVCIFNSEQTEMLFCRPLQKMAVKNKKLSYQKLTHVQFLGAAGNKANLGGPG